MQVNGRTVREMGTRADPEVDVVTVDGVRVRPPDTATYLALHKPPGYITTADDPQGRPTALDLPWPTPASSRGTPGHGQRGVAAPDHGREWAQRVLHPSYGCTKEYLVEVEGRPAPAALACLRQPMQLGRCEEWTAGAEVRLVDSCPDAACSRS